MRQTLHRLAQLLAVGLVAAATVTVPAQPGSSGEKQRTTAEPYTTSVPGGPVDCATNENGVCLDLGGDEFSVHLAVDDDEGWVDIPLRAAFADASGQELSSTEHCGSGTANVPVGSVLLVVEVAAVTAGTCAAPAVSQSGTVTASFALKRNASEVPADDERRCTGGLGEPVSYALAPDDGHRVAIDALILLDGVTEQAGAELMAKVANGYSDDGIDLIPSFRPVSLAPASLDVDPMFDAIKAETGGEVPDGFELVHVLTDKDINGWGGYAYCVGGIQSRAHAFSWSEVRGQTINIIRGVPAPVWFWGDDYLAAHEIGHLFGGGHDLANCAEGVAVEEGEVPAPCTLMHPNLNVSYVFSTINRAVVRGHALDFADEQP